MPSFIFYFLAASSLVALGSTAALPRDGLSEVPRLRRSALQTPFNGLPACNSRETDPTWAVGTSAYKDGEGKFIGSDCDNHAKKKEGHCWTDYYLVGTKDSYNPWYEAIGDINCPDSGKGSCSQAVAKTAQSCTSFTWSVSQTISTEFDLEIVKMSLSVTATEGQTYQSCNGNTTTATCEWTDGGCHSVWASQRMTTVLGYKRRSCNSPTNDPKANMQNSPQRADGFYTRGMQDFQVPLTGVSAIECQGTCSPTYSPGALPNLPNNGAMKPWSQ